MHRCPQCDYAFGSLPGVPKGRFDAFSADVTCPECAYAIPAGARLVAGSSIEAGAQPLTHARRNRQVLVALAPMGYLLITGLQGISDLALKWSAGVTAWDFLKVATLPLVGFILWGAWRKWTPRPERDGRAPAAFDRRWICAPGALIVFEGEPSGTATSVPPWKRHDAADIHSIVAGSPFDRRRRWNAGDRPVVALTANVWTRGRDGRRNDLSARTVFVDIDSDPGPPGVDRTVALLEAGNRLARAVRASIVTGEAMNEPAPADAGDGAPPPLAIEGPLHAYAPWPQPANVLNAAFALPVTFAMLAIGVWAMFTWAVPVTARQGITPALVAAAAVGAVVLPAAILTWVVLLRRLRRRTMIGCHWCVGPHGIRVTERHLTAKGEMIEEFTRDVPARDIATIELRPRQGRIRLVACGRDGREVAGIAPDAFPDDGAEALVQRVRERVACERPLRGRPTP